MKNENLSEIEIVNLQENFSVGMTNSWKCCQCKVENYNDKWQCSYCRHERCRNCKDLEG